MWHLLRTQYYNATHKEYIPSGSATPENESTSSFPYVTIMDFVKKCNEPPVTLATYHLPCQQMDDDSAGDIELIDDNFQNMEDCEIIDDENCHSCSGEDDNNELRQIEEGNN
ncbi:uncharacterized protein LOC122511997 [Leptopilina heterotoma]|uniref:uncharacterized protein LOC122511997 n=1 Tax=Leptopilina heterotoma TaxID=63436 RepID=UPI001CA81130|nr:uncharacterized protein LOC122511997 [Leptopilina heterotoma]